MCGAKTVEEGGRTHFQNPLRTAASPELEPERKKEELEQEKARTPNYVPQDFLEQFGT